MATFKVKDIHWEIFHDFFSTNKELITGRLNHATGREQCKKLWSDLTLQLNSAGLGEKSTEKWQKTWSDYKCSLKKKAAEINRSRVATGGGPEHDKKLSELEVNFLQLLGESFYKGSGVQEHGLPTLSSAEESTISDPGSSNSSKRKWEGEQQVIIQDHDYLMFTPEHKKKQKKEDEYMTLYKETLDVLKEINTNLLNVSNSMSILADAVATIAQNSVPR